MIIFIFGDSSLEVTEHGAFFFFFKQLVIGKKESSGII